VWTLKGENMLEDITGRKNGKSVVLGIVGIAFALIACSTPAPVVETQDEAPLNGDSVPEENQPDMPSDNDNTRESAAADEQEGNDEVNISEEVPQALSGRGWETDWTQHTVPYDEIISGGVPRDGIRSIDDPTFKTIEQTDEWLTGTEPVIALEIDGEARAYPLSILTQHEIVNDTLNGVPVVVTFCPLCNSSVVFDRRVDGQVYEFGVSGLLRNSDLIMYDRATESLWQQFTGEGIVGLHAGDQLSFLPSTLISYTDFKTAYPDGVVLSDERPGRRYGSNPYQNYDQTTGRPFLYIGEIDPRLPVMMRVVGLNINGETKAYPFIELAQVDVVNDTVGGQDVAIFYQFGTNSALGASIIAQAEDVGAATVFDPVLDGQKLTFTLGADGFVDEQTGSRWNMVGQAVDGELVGAQLTPIKYSSDFWFAWAAFHEDTLIYQAN